MLTKGRGFDIMSKLSRGKTLGEQVSTLKIKQRWNKNPEKISRVLREAKRTFTEISVTRLKNVSEWRNERLSSKNGLNTRGCLDIIFREFDPGSGRTLAACLTHASRTMKFWRRLRPTEGWISGGRVSNAWVTCLSEWNNIWKRMVIPHNVTEPHDSVTKGAIRWKMDSRPIS